MMNTNLASARMMILDQVMNRWALQFREVQITKVLNDKNILNCGIFELQDDECLALNSFNDFPSFSENTDVRA